MLQTIILSFLAGLAGGNGIPHFGRGITRQHYPNVLGNGPIPNLLAGWTAIVIAGILVFRAGIDRHPLAAAISGAVGLLLIGLFHAGPGAFGRKERS